MKKNCLYCCVWCWNDVETTIENAKLVIPERLELQFKWSCHLAKSRDQGIMWLYEWESLKVSHHSPKFGEHRHYGSKDICNLSCDFAKPHDQWVMWHYGLDPLMVSLHPAKFCDMGDIKFLVVEEQDSTWLLNCASTIHLWSTWHKPHGMSCW